MIASKECNLISMDSAFELYLDIKNVLSYFCKVLIFIFAIIQDILTTLSYEHLIVTKLTVQLMNFKENQKFIFIVLFYTHIKRSIKTAFYL